MLVFTMLFLVAACSQKTDSRAEETAASTAMEEKKGTTAAQSGAPATETKTLSGEINIEGSSTVYPISSAIAEEFSKLFKDVNVSVGFAGTSSGFKKLYAGQIHIGDASRPISQEEIDKCKENGIEYTEFKVAFDSISVVVNKENTWVESLTADQLKAMWEPDSKVKTWKDVNPEWPADQIKFYAPGADSGMFEYFTEAIIKKKDAIRTDITSSGDDNALVTSVANDKNAIAFFGYAYYLENKDKLNIVKVDCGKGPIEPTVEMIKNGTYIPLSRPLFIYVNNKDLAEDHIKEYVKFYLSPEGRKLVADVGYVPLDDKEYDDQLAKLK